MGLFSNVAGREWIKAEIYDSVGPRRKIGSSGSRLYTECQRLKGIYTSSQTAADNIAVSAGAEFDISSAYTFHEWGFGFKSSVANTFEIYAGINGVVFLFESVSVPTTGIWICRRITCSDLKVKVVNAATVTIIVRKALL
jgi:hypothetical protein